ncbi:hypothetical protein TKK_0004185 [Trichogramma kaykai]|uniref:Probable Ufm1-specific protease 2 n=1 Tax=Trichogramma kaykai TaxID=54128 RepID=A0ABD2XKH7_9HYME
MAPRLKVLSNVIDRFAKLNAAVTGYLYGIVYEETLTVLTFSINPVDDSDDPILPIDLQLSLPAEVDLLGILYVDQYRQDIPDAFKEIDVTDNPLLIKYSLDATEVNAFYYIHQKLEPINYEVIDESSLLQNFCYIRLQANIPFLSEEMNIMDSLQDTRKYLAAGKVGFYFNESETYLLGNDIKKDTRNMTTKELVNASKNQNNSKNSKYIPLCFVDTIDAKMFLKMSSENNLDDEPVHLFAPVVQHIKKSIKYCEMSLKIDTLALVGYNINMAQLYEILVESLCRNLRLISFSFENQLKTENMQLQLPEPIHVKPLDFGHLLTAVYPVGLTEAENQIYRRNLHRRFALDLKKPYFKKENALRFKNDKEKMVQLINPHEIITHPNQNISIVQGQYAYHHYMQDGIDDSGWGCAYRSLQTIVSWYRLQGYTNKPIPTHREIQKCLVDIGDKPSSFIGSKQWIGSTEVGYVLETLEDIPIRVLSASSGEEMATLAPDLDRHFRTQGTPVMIGGGVLAHTILGVSYDESFKNVQFLILDPHYTGPEQVNTIVNKGWCGWKKSDFWKKDAFYNMCLPQRPNKF